MQDYLDSLMYSQSRNHRYCTMLPLSQHSQSHILLLTAAQPHNGIWWQICCFSYAFTDLKVAPTLRKLVLSISDQNTSTSANYLHPQTLLTSLAHLEISSKCENVHEALPLEIMRACKPASLKTLALPFALKDFTTSSWVLVADRGGLSLAHLEITPALDSRNGESLGWPETVFSFGLELMTKSCKNLEFLDITGHNFGVSPDLLGLILREMRMLKRVYLGGGMGDEHLFKLLTSECGVWPGLSRLSISSQAGVKTVSTKTPVLGSRFSSGTLKALIIYLDKVLVGQSKVVVIIPEWLISVGTGKPLRTHEWADSWMKRELLDAPEAAQTFPALGSGIAVWNIGRVNCICGDVGGGRMTKIFK